MAYRVQKPLKSTLSIQTNVYFQFHSNFTASCFCPKSVLLLIHAEH